MPTKRLLGPRARFKPGAMMTLSQRDPGRFQKYYNGTYSPNISAIAEALDVTPSTLHRMNSGALPLNLDVVAALATFLGTWNFGEDLLDVLDENGNPIDLDEVAAVRKQSVPA